MPGKEWPSQARSLLLPLSLRCEVSCVAAFTIVWENQCCKLPLVSPLLPNPAPSIGPSICKPKHAFFHCIEFVFCFKAQLLNKKTYFEQHVQL